MEFTALSIIRVNRHVTTKVAYNSFANIQTHANTLLVLFATTLELSKDFEKFNLLTLFDSNTSVYDAEVKSLQVFVKININSNRTLGSKLHGI